MEMQNFYDVMNSRTITRGKHTEKCIAARFVTTVVVAKEKKYANQLFIVKIDHTVEKFAQWVKKLAVASATFFLYKHKSLIFDELKSFT